MKVAMYLEAIWVKSACVFFMKIFLLFYLLTFSYSTNAQCIEGTLTGMGSTTSNMQVAQSFQMNCVTDGVFSSIIILNTSNATNVTLTIRDGDDPDGTIRYTQTGIILNVLSPQQNIIVLEGGIGSLEYKAGQNYTFRLDADAPLILSKSPGTGETYSMGTLYEGGTTMASQDLLFEVTTVVSSVLPVELTDFRASYQNGQCILNWQTASESNNQGFELERSSNLRNWDKLAFIAGNGNTNSMSSYEFKDIGIQASGEYYYRLKQIDWDGQAEYHPSISIYVEREEGQINIYPNPVNKGSRLYISSTYNNDATIKLIDASGRLIFNTSIEDHKELYLPASLSPGLYVMEYISKGYHHREKLMVK